MIHSNKHSVEVARGRKVSTMIKRLSRDTHSPPPTTNVMVEPTLYTQHNNNMPFSYTQPRTVTPEKIIKQTVRSENTPSPVIYSQVVCGNGLNDSGHGKTRIYNSDSDEGLGYEDNVNSMQYTRFESNIHNFCKEDGLQKSTSAFVKTEIHPEVGSYVKDSGDRLGSRNKEHFQPNGVNSNIKNDLSYRRSQLESRINRRLSERYNSNHAPSAADKQDIVGNKYISNTMSRYSRRKSASPVNVKEKYVPENSINSESVFHKEYKVSSKYHYPSQRNEPSYVEKSVHTQISDVRSSPEHIVDRKPQHTVKEYRTLDSNQYQTGYISRDNDLHKSNPDMFHSNNNKYEERSKSTRAYHTSHTKQKNVRNVSNGDHYLEYSETEHKDKLRDSGNENDFRPDSGDNTRTVHKSYHSVHPANDSEDEGFASSLLIASERQHTEDITQPSRNVRIHDSDNVETMTRKQKIRHEYTPRERCIDDGSHYDPRIDKDLGVKRHSSTLRRMDQKPPKPLKKSGLEKVKQLFSRDSHTKKDESLLVNEEVLRARYNEYRGENNNSERSTNTIIRKGNTNKSPTAEYVTRRRLSTPSPSPTRETNTLNRAKESNTKMFKSLDRLSRKRNAKVKTGTTTPVQSTPAAKSLRFFGDSDHESSNDSSRRTTQSTLQKSRRAPVSQSARNIFEDVQDGNDKVEKHSPPTQSRRIENGRKKYENNIESSNDGDSSQQSQRSMVYLHAPTVGDIPGLDGSYRSDRYAGSREKLSSTGQPKIRPQIKTLSRSFSMLAPWKPRYYHKGYEVNYDQEQPTSDKGYLRTDKKVITENSNKRKNSDNRTLKSQSSSVNRKSKSKENISESWKSKEELSKEPSGTLYKKKHRMAKESSRYNRGDKDVANKSMSTESLNRKKTVVTGKDANKVSRSLSMPREKSAGWFTSTKKNKSNISRL